MEVDSDTPGPVDAFTEHVRPGLSPKPTHGRGSFRGRGLVRSNYIRVTLGTYLGHLFSSY